MTKIKQTPEEKKLRAKELRLYKTYGITLKEFDDLLISQGMACAVCKKIQPRMCVDHIHIKGFKAMSLEEKKKYVRGIACFMCNTGFKSFEKTVDGVRNRQALNGTFEYFKKYKLKGEI